MSCPCASTYQFGCGGGSPQTMKYSGKKSGGSPVKRRISKKNKFIPEKDLYITIKRHRR
jgi:hypothetical protein